MNTLWIYGSEAKQRVLFEPPMSLSALLEQAGVSRLHPCGGRGACGKCAVEIVGQVSPPNEAELRAGCRLACQIQVLGDAEVTLPEQKKMDQIQGSILQVQGGVPMDGTLGAAIDIGTTTIAVQVYDLHSGRQLGQAAALNPQTTVAADVMGRISAAMEGQLEKLSRQVCSAIEMLLQQACGADAARIDRLVITGNTTMLYLLTGRDPACLSRAPFQADTLFDVETELLGRAAYLPGCMNAFVGADITCAVLASEMCSKRETALLCDVGTNGEIALWKDGVLYVTSTAAGPAFEGAGISCGCGSVEGAIDRVWVENGALAVHTIGEGPAVGICGSGLIDAVAALLELGWLDETGAMDDDVCLMDDVVLLQKDIRAIQLAKSAIAAGIKTLMEMAEITGEEINTFYIAGGFGSHLNVRSAAAIGLFPAQLTDKVKVLGNAALSGTIQLMLDQERLSQARTIAANARHYNLGGNPTFNEYFMDEILFPCE